MISKTDLVRKFCHQNQIPFTNLESCRFTADEVSGEIRLDESKMSPEEIREYQSCEHDFFDTVVAIEQTPVANKTKTRIEQLREIVTEQSCMKIDGVLVDLFSASAAVKVYDALNEKNRASFISLPLTKMMTVTWKLLS